MPEDLRGVMRRVVLASLIGVVMGSASVVPGLSAGTIAVVLGVYPHLVESLGRLKLVRVIPMGLGWVLGALVGVQTVGWGFGQVPGETHAFLLGIVLASAMGIFRDHPPDGAEVPVAGLSFALVWWLVPITSAGLVSAQPLEMWELVGSGVASGGAMILPGFSGGTALVLLGVYSRVVATAAAWDWRGMFLFASGAIAGVLGTAAILWRAYEARESTVYALLGGLTAGSLRALIPTSVSLSVILVGALGLGMGLLLNGFHRRDSREKGDESS